MTASSAASRWSRRRPSRLTVKIILEGGIRPEQVLPRLEAASDKIRLVMGPNCRIDYQFVDDIPLTTTGKHAYVVRMPALGASSSASAAA